MENNLRYVNRPILPEVAKELMAMDLDDKVITSYSKKSKSGSPHGKANAMSVFSGGKDSSVLAYLVAWWLSSFRTPPYPLTLVFVNTGLEYPEIQRFANTYTEWLRAAFPRIEINLIRLRPKKNIKQVLSEYGYPIISKEVSRTVFYAKRGAPIYQKKLNGELKDKNGEKSSFTAEKWKFLLDAPFKVSDACCRIMKKSPAKALARKEKTHAIIATMADESRLRKRNGCAMGAMSLPASAQLANR